MKTGCTVGKILLTGRRPKQCRDMPHPTADSRRFKADLPLVHHNNTGYLTANHFAEARQEKAAQKPQLCPGKSVLSCPVGQDSKVPGVNAQAQPRLQLGGSRSSRQGLPFSLFSMICLQGSGADEPTHSAALLLPMHSSLGQHGHPWDLAGSFLP